MIPISIYDEDIGRTLETVGLDISIFGADRRIGGLDSDERVETDDFVIWGEGPTPITDGLGLPAGDFDIFGFNGRSIDGGIPIIDGGIPI